MVIANALGIFLFLYLYWKRLKEDYSSEKIFNSGFIVLTGVVLGIILSNYYFTNYWFYIIFGFLLICLGVNVIKLKLKLFESIDTLVISLLPWLSLYYLSDSISKSSLHSFIAFWICLLLIFIFFFLNTFYKSFSWYKSGKIGFSGLVTMGLFFLLRGILLSGFELYVSGPIAFLSFLLLYMLSIQHE